MKFESTTAYEKTGMYLGFLVSYLIFTAILYSILYLLSSLKNVPFSWSFVQAGITLIIVGLGLVLRWLLR